MELWQKRGPYAPPDSTDVFVRKEDFTRIPPGTIGRDRLVLKARSVETFMYYTTDND